MHPANANREPVGTGLAVLKGDWLAGSIVSENTPSPRDLQVRRLQRMFGLARSTAYAVAELAFAGLPR